MGGTVPGHLSLKRQGIKEAGSLLKGKSLQVAKKLSVARMITCVWLGSMEINENS